MKLVEKEDTLYICDPDRNKDCPKDNCHVNDGPCEYTTNPEFAKIGTMPIKKKVFVKEL